MQTFDQALFGHVKAGRVTFEDAMKVASSPHDFKLLIAGRRPPGHDDGGRRAAAEQRAATPAPTLTQPDRLARRCSEPGPQALQLVK